MVGVSGESPMPITDPQALAAIVSNLDGTVVEPRTFQFDLPLGEVRNAIPKITAMTGVGCRRVEGCDHVEQSVSGPQTIVRLELYNKEQTPKEAPSLLDFMDWR